jgi:hypothetical protein
MRKPDQSAKFEGWPILAAPPVCLAFFHFCAVVPHRILPEEFTDLLRGRLLESQA